MRTYVAIATRAKGWWSVQVRVPRAVVVTQARTLAQVDEIVRDAIAVATDVSPDSFGVDVKVELPRALQSEVLLARDAHAVASRAQQLSSRALSSAATSLTRHGLTVRDVGLLLGISAQRVSQVRAGGSNDNREPKDLVDALLTAVDELRSRPIDRVHEGDGIPLAVREY